MDLINKLILVLFVFDTFHKSAILYHPRIFKAHEPPLLVSSFLCKLFNLKDIITLKTSLL